MAVPRRRGSRIKPSSGRKSSQVSSSIKGILYLVLAGAYSSASLLNLSPVYGSIPSSLYHTRALAATLLLGVSTTIIFRWSLPQGLAPWLPVLALWIPTIQHALFKLSSFLGPVFGPFLTEILTIHPLSLLSTLVALEAPINATLPPQLSADLLRGFGAISIFFIAAKTATWLIHSLTGLVPFFLRCALQVVFGCFYACLSPSNLLWLAAPSILHAILFNVHMPFLQTARLLPHVLQPESNFTVLSRQDSVTGYISVVENRDPKIRVLRCDHSLLGGEWLPPPGGWGHVATIREPIYAVFAMLEAVRLVEVGNPKTHAQDRDASPEALVIGLGVGTSAAALIAHGVNTTIVEIDPVIHDYAMQYFGLPSNHIAEIEDAVTFVQRAVREHLSYDYIIHDVFTGGAEPVDLFTVEFISGLRRLLKPDGVIAINYAGDLLLPPAGLIIRTITSLFPSCRIFREEAAPNEANLERDFTNLVIFCINSRSSFRFRRPTDADLLGSPFRSTYLFPEHEVHPKAFQRRAGDEEVLRQSNKGKLEKWGAKGAIAHWRILRTVLPDALWENW